MGNRSHAIRAGISLENVRGLLDRFPAPLAFIRELRHVYVNPRFEELTGYSASDLESMPFGTLCHDRSRDVIRQICLDWQFGRSSLQHSRSHIIKKSERRVEVTLYWGNAVIDGAATTILVSLPSQTEPREALFPSPLLNHDPHSERYSVLRSLSPRLRVVLELIAYGRSNREIANELGIGEATVKVHVHRLLAKIGAKNRIEAIFFAQEIGIGPRR